MNDEPVWRTMNLNENRKRSIRSSKRYRVKTWKGIRKRDKKFTTPSEEDSSNPRKAGIAAGGVVLMSKGSHSLLEGELPCTDGDPCFPPFVPSRGLPRRTLRPGQVVSYDLCFGSFPFSFHTFYLYKYRDIGQRDRNNIKPSSPVLNSFTDTSTNQRSDNRTLDFSYSKSFEGRTIVRVSLYSSWDSL